MRTCASLIGPRPARRPDRFDGLLSCGAAVAPSSLLPKDTVSDCTASVTRRRLPPGAARRRQTVKPKDSIQAARSGWNRVADGRGRAVGDGTAVGSREG
eukprot:356939-Chlamydomonas_euryale.AAC.4